MTLDFAEPGLDILEAFGIADIKHQEDALRSFVVSGNNGFKLLLASSVPHLKLYYTSALLYSSDLEVNSDSGEKGFVEDIIGKTEQ